MTRIQLEGVRTAYVDWIKSQVEWHIFATLTFRYYQPHEGVEKSLRGWLFQWAKSQAGFSVAKAWVRGKLGFWVAGIESSQSGRLHAHMLLGGCCERWQRSDGWKLWFDRYGGAKIEKVLDSDHATAYVTKYVVGPTSELLVGNLPGSRPFAQPATSVVAPGASILDAPGASTMCAANVFRV